MKKIKKKANCFEEKTNNIKGKKENNNNNKLSQNL